MANIPVPELSRFQLGLLTHTASADVPIFLLPRPSVTDSASQRFNLKARFNEVLSLEAMGLMEECSDEFRDYIESHRRKTGRKFKVFGLTEFGFKMFSKGIPATVN